MSLFYYIELVIIVIAISMRICTSALFKVRLHGKRIINKHSRWMDHQGEI